MAVEVGQQFRQAQPALSASESAIVTDLALASMRESSGEGAGGAEMKTYNSSYRLNGISPCKDYSACASFSGQNGRLSGGVHGDKLTARGAAEGSKEVFRLAGRASRAGNNVTLTLVHSHADEPAEVAIRLRDSSAATVRQTVFAHETLNAHNTFDKPDEVIPKSSDTKLQGASLTCVLPAASMTRLDIRLC